MRTYILVILFLFSFLANVEVVRAQVSGTSLNYLDILPQKDITNPAHIAPYDFYIGLPVLSNLNLLINNDFLSWNSIFDRGVDDSLRINVPKLLSKVHGKNLLGVELNTDIFRMGMRLQNNGYLTIGISAHASFNIVTTKTTLDFLFRGPGQYIGQNDLSNNAISLNSYIDLYAGYAHQISDKITVGGKFKIINGLYNVNTAKSGLLWNVLDGDMENSNELTPYTYTLNVDGEINTNLPVNEDFSLGKLGLPIGQNWGFGIDLGISYDFAENWNFSASLLDVGAIFWRGKTVELAANDPNTEIAYQGIVLNNIFDIENTDLLGLVEESLLNVLDTLGFVPTQTKGYTTSLPTTFTAGFTYTLAEKHQFGVLFKGKIMNKYFLGEMGVAYTFTPCKNFAISVNNVFTPTSALNFGFAMVGNIGPVQLYLGVDRLNSFNVAAMRTVNVNFGINFVFGKHEILPSKIAKEKHFNSATKSSNY